MTRSDRIALIISLLAVLAAALVHQRIFEGLAHIEDEMAYVWQAQTIARGDLWLPSPPQPKSFLVPFIIDYMGIRFGKYPLGWPAMLAIGEFLGLRYLVNPLLAGLGVWLIYRLSKRLMGETVGLLAAGLTVTSPFFLMNSGSLLSHPFGLVLSVAFALAWLEAFCTPGSQANGLQMRWLATLTAALSLGLLVLSRPLTAICIGLPFGLHGLYLLFKGDWETRRRLVVLGLVSVGLGLLHFLWQYAVTGDPALNPYTLWWAYDKVGFGPGYGHSQGGHTLYQAWVNTRFSLTVGWSDLFGWLKLSWIFLPFGVWAMLRQRNGQALLVVSVIPCLVIIYMAYWIGSHLFGPRYYYEGLYALAMTSAAGIAWLAGWPTCPHQPFPNYTGWRRWRALGVTAVVLLLVASNLFFYTPIRLNGMFGLYGVERAHMAPFQTPEMQKLAPALVIVHVKNDWIEYGTLLELQDPYLDTPFIFVISRGTEQNQAVARAFPGRHVYHYYPLDDPYTLLDEPKQ